MEEDLIRIEAYLAGSMPSDKRAQFEQELESREDLRQLLANSLALDAAIQQEESRDWEQRFKTRYQELKSSDKLPDVPKELQEEMKQGKSRPLWTLWGGIGLAIAAAIALFFLIKGSGNATKMDGPQLFAANYEAPAYQEVKSLNSDSLWNKTLLALKSQNYDSARSWIAVLLEDPDFDRKSEAHLYLGHLEMESKNYEAALASYKKVDIQVQTAEWYSLLAHLALDQRGEAAELLKKLSQYDFYKERANNIASALDYAGP